MPVRRRIAPLPHVRRRPVSSGIPVAAPPRFLWRNILLVILAVALIIFGFAWMSGGQRGVWGASHRTHHPQH